MWIKFVLLSLSIVYIASSSSELIPDVTTIYDIKNICRLPQPELSHLFAGPGFWDSDEDLVPSPRPNTTEEREVCDGKVYGRVYKRTNALGLDLYTNAGRFEAQVDEPGWSCDVNLTSECEFTGWSDGYETSGIGMPIKFEKTYLMTKYFSIKLNVRNNPAYIRPNKFIVVFTELDSNIREQSYFHVMEVFLGQVIKTTFYTSCRAYTSSSSWRFRDRDGDVLFMGCSSSHNSLNIDYESTTLTFEYGYNGNVKLFVNGNSSAIMDFDAGRKMNFAYMYRPMSDAYEIPDRKFMTISKSTPIKVSSNVGSNITSPSFVPASKRICLTLVLNCSTDTKSNVLRISAVDLYETVHVVYDVNNLKAGWQVKHVRIEINSKITTPIKIIITKLNGVEIQVRRLSSCSSEGLEVVMLSPYYVKSAGGMNDAPVYTATSETMPFIDKIYGVSNHCLNGGVLTTAGCACLPGFSGSTCQIGCGRNKIGQDCEGRCSLRSRECSGFMVCSPFTGCKCAPGYGGYNCTTKCSEGRYGNGCENVCGNCADGQNCDIYSGECESCSVGYVSPYCNQAYVYYSLQPRLVAEKYRSITVYFDLQQGIRGVGEPKLYQLQFREQGALDWKIHTIKTVPEKNVDEFESLAEENQIKETIEDLKAGTGYWVRVLLMDASFNKYDGDLVQPARLLTKCDIPEELDYGMISSSNTTDFTFSWHYEVGNENQCPVEFYEVFWLENGLRMTNFTLEPMYTMTDFGPGSTIQFKVRAKTTGGFAPYSKTIKISTKLNGTSAVRDLRVVASKGTSLDIAWRPPIDYEDRIMQYKITFKCESQVACSPGCKDSVEGQVTKESTSVTLNSLLPFTQYLVTVTPENGPQSKLYVGTTEAVPTEAPVLSNQKPVRSNASVTVFWEPVSVCSSFLKGYTYQLTKATESMKLISSGFTKDTSTSFYNLTASTDYMVKVFIDTVAGWNPDAFLLVNISTSATVPDAVQNLTVYKRGRTMLGLRWVEPKHLYGELKSFTVQYSLGEDVISETVDPFRCVVWPENYCHTLENLKSNRKYTIMVSARNKDIPEDGAVATLTTVTKENAPTAPEDLRVFSITSTSVSLQWKPPSSINGVLRSFLVNVEESEKFDQDSCCQDYPLVEIQVKEEKAFYQVEVSGLHPASTYYMSVSAKTVSMGPSQSLVIHTRPPHLNVTVLPTWSSIAETVHLNNVQDMNWLPQENLSEVNKSQIFTPLIRAHIVLDYQNSTNQSSFSRSEAMIKDEQLFELLGKYLPGPFRFIAEYKEVELVQESKWGRETPVESLPSSVEDRQLIAVQISDYNGAYNVDLRYSYPVH